MICRTQRYCPPSNLLYPRARPPTSPLKARVAGGIVAGTTPPPLGSSSVFQPQDLQLVRGWQVVYNLSSAPSTQAAVLRWGIAGSKLSDHIFMIMLFLL